MRCSPPLFTLFDKIHVMAIINDRVVTRVGHYSDICEVVNVYNNSYYPLDDYNERNASKLLLLRDYVVLDVLREIILTLICLLKLEPKFEYIPK